MRLLWAFLLALLPLSAQAESAYDRVIKTGTLRCGYAISPPILTKDANTGTLSGWNRDVVEALVKELGLKLDWVEEVGWGNFIEGLNTNRYDAFCSLLWPDAGRLRQTSLAGPVSFDFSHVYVRADETRFSGGLPALNQPEVVIPVIEGDVTVALADNFLPNVKKLSLAQTSTVSDLILSVVTKKADILILTPGMFADYDKSNPGALRRLEGVPPSSVYGTYFAVRSNELQLRDILQAGLRNMIDSGRLKQVVHQHDATQILPKSGY
jgi:polar amino acid transport system substrate-binding protein